VTVCSKHAEKFKLEDVQGKRSVFQMQEDCSTQTCQCTIIIRSAPLWYGSVLWCFCNAPLMHRGLSVCRSTFSILAKRLSGIIQWDAVGDGGWGGVCIGVLDFGGDRRREWAVFGGWKFASFHCNQWDCLREAQRGGSSQITLGFFLLYTLCLKKMS